MLKVLCQSHTNLEGRGSMVTMNIPPPDTPIAPTEWRSIAQLVERQARAAPDAVAVSDTAGHLTYRELHGHAARLARKLRARGVRRETGVGLHLERSRELLVAFLAVLRAGGTAYLLDPRWPAARIQSALQALPPRLLLTAPGTAPPDTIAERMVVGLDTAPDDGRAHDLPVPVHPDNLAYVVHTSGSTGEPKAVGVTHRSVEHCVNTHTAGHRIEPADRGSWLASPGSSAGVGEIWPYLASGASVHTTEPEVIASPAELRDWLLVTGITKAFLSTPTAEELVALAWPRECRLRLVTVGGDRVLRWAPATLPFEVAVSYGSAEANGVTSCLTPWDRRLTSHTATADDRAAAPPVGRAWPGVHVLLLEENLEPAAADAVAELFVLSCELTRGYLGNPRLTAERLLPGPHGGGERMYRTGDLGWIDANGLLHHKGRTDQMLKIRGLRVDPADVEAALLEHPAVSSAAVVGITESGERTRLAAYVVVRDGQPTDAAQMRRFVRDRLPDPMVPEAVVVLPRLPLTATGKVDRRALPVPRFPASEPAAEVAVRTSEIDDRVRDLWRYHLGVPTVTSEDHFLDRGGTSLTAGRLIASVRDELGVAVRLREFMRRPTLEALLRQVRSAPRRR
jgi:amino acid adenylation domain-containing protein